MNVRALAEHPATWAVAVGGVAAFAYLRARHTTASSAPPPVLGYLTPAPTPNDATHMALGELGPHLSALHDAIARLPRSRVDQGPMFSIPYVRDPVTGRVIAE